MQEDRVRRVGVEVVVLEVLDCSDIFEFGPNHAIADDGLLSDDTPPNPRDFL